jgi:hypothetical protein
MSQTQPPVSPMATPAHLAQPSHTTPGTTHPSSTTAHQQPVTMSENPATNHASNNPELATTSAPQTFMEKLNAGDHLWQWKIGMRVILIIISFIGLGCAAWIVNNFTSKTMYYGYLVDSDDSWSIPWVLITFALTIIWSTACILVFMLRKSHRALHPGAQVGVDLILWLGYIVTGLLAVYAVLEILQYGSGGVIGRYYSGDGPWTYVQGNDTWVYNQTSYSSSYYGSSSRSRMCDSSSKSSYSPGMFQSCAEEDAYVNHLWKTKNSRFNAVMCAVVCQWMALLLHFVLFVWACVDTNRKRRGKVSKDSEKAAAKIIENMIQVGAIVPVPGQAHMKSSVPQPMPPQLLHAYYAQYPLNQQYPQQQNQQMPQQMQQQIPQQHPQQYPQQPQQPQHFSRPLSSPASPQSPMIRNQPAVPSSSNEKPAGTRYL